jgi:hypothetical protein
MRCRSGDRCARESVAGQRFCEPHLTELRAIRADLEREATQDFASEKHSEAARSAPIERPPEGAL